MPAEGETLPLHKHAGIAALVAFLANIFTAKLFLPEYSWGVNTMEGTNITNIWVVDDDLQLQPLPGGPLRCLMHQLELLPFQMSQVHHRHRPGTARVGDLGLGAEGRVEGGNYLGWGRGHVLLSRAQIT